MQEQGQRRACVPPFDAGAETAKAPPRHGPGRRPGACPVSAGWPEWTGCAAGRRSPLTDSIQPAFPEKRRGQKRESVNGRPAGRVDCIHGFGNATFQNASVTDDSGWKPGEGDAQFDLAAVLKSAIGVELGVEGIAATAAGSRRPSSSASPATPSSAGSCRATEPQSCTRKVALRQERRPGGQDPSRALRRHGRHPFHRRMEGGLHGRCQRAGPDAQERHAEAGRLRSRPAEGRHGRLSLLGNLLPRLSPSLPSSSPPAPWDLSRSWLRRRASGPLGLRACRRHEAARVPSVGARQGTGPAFPEHFLFRRNGRRGKGALSAIHRLRPVLEGLEGHLPHPHIPSLQSPQAPALPEDAAGAEVEEEDDSMRPGMQAGKSTPSPSRIRRRPECQLYGWLWACLRLRFRPAFRVCGRALSPFWSMITVVRCRAADGTGRRDGGRD